MRRTPKMAGAALILALLAGCAGYGRPYSPAAVPRWRRGDPPSIEASGARLGRSDLPRLDENAALEDYLAYAALNNAALKAAFHEWQAAVEKAPQVTALPDPRFTYSYFIREVETRVGPQRQTFTLAQMFPWPGKLDLKGQAAVQGAKAAGRRYESRKLKLFYSVKDAYYEHYYLGRAIAVVREQRDFLKYVEEVVRTRYKTAAVDYGAVLRAQVELGVLDDRLTALEEMRGPIVARLNAALNRPVAAELPWPPSIPSESMDATDKQVLQWFLEASPELKAMDHEIGRRQRLLALAMKDYYPDLTFGLTYVQTDTALMSGAPDSGKDPVTAMLSINVPLWWEKYRAHEREAEALLAAAIRTKTEKENRGGSMIRMVLYDLHDDERKISLYRDTLLPRARQALKTTETSFRAGKASFIDLMDAQRVLLQFELSHQRALVDRAQRLAQLEMLVGREIPTRAAEPDGEDAGEPVGL